MLEKLKEEVYKANMDLPACAQLVAHGEWVCTIPPIFGNSL